MTVQITTKQVDALFPYQLLWFLVSSPAQYEAVGRSWEKFAFAPSGTGPFRMGTLVPREKMELVRNPDYWDKTRIAKLDRLVLVCSPEDLARTNALLAGQVDLIEAPAPDAVPQLKSVGHARCRQRHAACLELPSVDGRGQPVARFAAAPGGQSGDRPGRGGAADGGPRTPGRPGRWTAPAPGSATRASRSATTWTRRASWSRDAGFSKQNPVKTTFMVPTGGTGQMLSMPMNEFIQQSWAEIGIALELKPVELEVAYTAWRKGAADPRLAGITGSNIAYVTSDPFYAIIRFYGSNQIAPAGVNWSHYKNDAGGQTDRARR